MDDTFAIERLDVDGLDQHLDEMAVLLRDCVHAGASVNFILPFEIDESRAFWTNKVRPALIGGTRILLIANSQDRIAGTVQLEFDTPPNQMHRADISKLLVHPDFRRRGIARELMVEIEKHADAIGRTLLTLDTASDGAETLYRSLGYAVGGVIPGFARDPLEDRLDPTVYMFKVL